MQISGIVIKAWKTVSIYFCRNITFHRCCITKQSLKYLEIIWVIWADDSEVSTLIVRPACPKQFVIVIDETRIQACWTYSTHFSICTPDLVYVTMQLTEFLEMPPSGVTWYHMISLWRQRWDSYSQKTVFSIIIYICRFLLEKNKNIKLVVLTVANHWMAEIKQHFKGILVIHSFSSRWYVNFPTLNYFYW